MESKSNNFKKANIKQKNSMPGQSCSGDRRSFLKRAGLGGLGLGMLMKSSLEEQIGHLTQRVNRFSGPSELMITDMRIAQVGNVPIVKIYTNQGVHGLGDVRDGADKRYALMLKSRILGENPCNVERIFKIIKQFGGHGRQGGGVSGVEMALWDLTGKVFNVPLYQLLGGKYRDKVRIYVDTPTVREPTQFAKKMNERLEQGFTIMKMDIGIGLIKYGTLGCYAGMGTEERNLWIDHAPIYKGSDYRKRD